MNNIPIRPNNMSNCDLTVNNSITPNHTYLFSNNALLDSTSAAALLNMSPAVLRRKARAGKIPGYFRGKWHFFEEELINYIKGLDNGTKLMPVVVDTKRSSLCPTNHRTSSRSTNAQARHRGNTASQPPMDSAYAELLKLAPKSKRRN